jgi:hypothetical protein
MKKNEMPEITYKMLVPMEVYQRLQRIEEEFNTENCQKRDNSTQTDQTFTINQSDLSEFVKILIIWFLWSLVYIIYYWSK